MCFRNPLVSAGLESVLSHTEKSCIASYYRQFSMIIKIKKFKINTNFVIPGLRPLTKLNLIILYFDIRGKLSIIRCDK